MGLRKGKWQSSPSNGISIIPLRQSETKLIEIAKGREKIKDKAVRRDIKCRLLLLSSRAKRQTLSPRQRHTHTHRHKITHTQRSIINWAQAGILVIVPEHFLISIISLFMCAARIYLSDVLCSPFSLSLSLSL